MNLKAFSSRKIAATVVACLLIVQVAAVQAQEAQSLGGNQKPAVQISASSFGKLLDLAYRIQKHPVLYKYLNKVFVDFLAINEQRQVEMGWPAKAKGLSESQLVYLLSTKPRFAVMANQYLELVNPAEVDQPKIEKLRMEMRDELNELLQKDQAWKDDVRRFADPTLPLNISRPKNQPGYTSIDFYVNHPHVEDGNNPDSKLLPGDDLKKVVLDFIGEAKKEVWYNVFDFDLKDVADALVAANQRGVSVTGGIDNETIDTRPEVKAIFDYLNSVKSPTLQTMAVDSVGLNHMKVIVRDPGGPNSATLFLSGNFTQSCIGPEGDLVKVPMLDRPKSSIPNANHAILLKGDLPAVIGRHHLRKVLIDGLRGKSDFPINGAYRVIGGQSEADKIANWVMISFSPNGGMGNVNGDILRQFILSTRGPLRALLFAFSSPNLVDAIQKRAANEAAAADDIGRFKFDFAAVGDTPFAMRDWSGLLQLSGLQQDKTTKTYSTVNDYPLREITGPDNFTLLQSQIRTAPAEYTMKAMTIGGHAVDVSAKLHHKVWIAPQNHVAVLGTSFNPSDNAESNNEQVVIVRDEKLSEKAMGMFYGLYNRSKGSVVNIADRRNKRLEPNDDDRREDRETETVEEEQVKPKKKIENHVEEESRRVEEIRRATPKVVTERTSRSSVAPAVPRLAPTQKSCRFAWAM